MRNEIKRNKYKIAYSLVILRYFSNIMLYIMQIREYMGIVGVVIFRRKSVQCHMETLFTAKGVPIQSLFDFFIQ